MYYPCRADPLEVIDILQRTKDLLEGYVTNREEIITKRKSEIAALQLKCEETARRTKLAKQFADHFFAERALIRTTVMQALDTAIAHGDEAIADIALTMLGKEYGKDFFGIMNKI